MKPWLTRVEPRLYLLALLAFFLMVNWGTVYRGLLYVNAGVTLLVLAWQMRAGWTRWSTLAGLFVIPLLLILLDQVAIGHLEMLKEFRSLLLASCLAVAVYLLAKPDPVTVLRQTPKLALWIVVGYTLVQVFALAVLRLPYGTSKNPHYLALYCALCLPVAIYFFGTASSRLRWLLAVVMLTLSYCLLHTGSRPAWLALMLCALAVPFFMTGWRRLVVLSAVILVPLALYAADIGGFGSRVEDLAVNITHEERVAIWRDAWTMQQASSLPQWIYGHGLDSFKQDFIAYSSWHGIADFNSPHNALLEVLYLSGILGLCLFIGMYIYLYRGFWLVGRQSSQRRRLALLLMALMTISLLFISITIPTVTHYNVNTLAYLAGVLLLLRENRPFLTPST